MHYAANLLGRALVIGLAMTACACSKSPMPEGFRDLTLGMSEESFLEHALTQKYENSFLRFDCQAAVLSPSIDLPRNSKQAAASAIQACRLANANNVAGRFKFLTVTIAPASPFREMRVTFIENKMESVLFSLDAKDDYTLRELVAKATSKLGMDPEHETDNKWCRGDHYQWASCKTGVRYSISRYDRCSDGSGGATIDISDHSRSAECRERNAARNTPNL